MINNTLLKGMITYKKVMSDFEDNKIVEFGLSYNSLGNFKKIHQIICLSKGKPAEFFIENLFVKDIIVVLGYLTSRDVDCKELTILNVTNFEPVKISGNIVFNDSSVDESIFSKYLEGYDYK